MRRGGDVENISAIGPSIAAAGVVSCDYKRPGVAASGVGHICGIGKETAGCKGGIRFSFRGGTVRYKNVCDCRGKVVSSTVSLLDTGISTII